MSVLDDLKRFDDKGCESCGGYRPDCWVPKADGSDGAHALCWICAHMVLVHDMPIGGLVHVCACPAHEIYPADVLAHRERLAQIIGVPKDRSQEMVSATVVPPAPMPNAPQSDAPGQLFTVVSPSYDERGRRDPDGPVLVQQFRNVDENRIELVSATVRPRVKRVVRTLSKKRQVS